MSARPQRQVNPIQTLANNQGRAAEEALERGATRAKKSKTVGGPKTAARPKTVGGLKSKGTTAPKKRKQPNNIKSVKLKFIVQPLSPLLKVLTRVVRSGGWQRWW